jgi:type II secretory pathway component GspD/PulD (secretin)
MLHLGRKASLLVAVALLLSGCDDPDSTCILLGAPVGALRDPRLASLDSTERQIQIEARIVGISAASLLQIGVAFPLTAPVVSGNGGIVGGSSGDPRDIIVPADVLGGPPGVPYLIPDGHHTNSFLGVVNENFVSPFGVTKVFPMLPKTGKCVTFDDLVVTLTSGFPGGSAIENIGTRNTDLSGAQIYHGFYGDLNAQSLLDAIENDSRNTVLDVPTLLLFDGQRTAVIAQDVEPALNDLEAAFKAKVESVTPAPLGIFSGPVLDFRPAIEANGDIRLEIQIDGQGLSFYYSTPFQAGGTPADLEIPVVQPSQDSVSIIVPEGQTLVIGGILRRNSSTIEAGIPGLHSLPIINTLFRSQFKEEQELMLFIQPRIISGN